MPNGKPGDHPINDILDHRLPVFSEVVDELVRRVAEYYPRERLWDLFPWFSPPPLPEFEAQLRSRLAELESDGRERGWEPKRQEAIKRDYPFGNCLEGWFFRVQEVSAAAYRAEGSDLCGRRVARNGSDPDELIEQCVADARSIQDQLN